MAQGVPRKVLPESTQADVESDVRSDSGGPGPGSVGLLLGATDDVHAHRALLRAGIVVVVEADRVHVQAHAKCHFGRGRGRAAVWTSIRIADDCNGNSHYLFGAFSVCVLVDASTFLIDSHIPLFLCHFYGAQLFRLCYDVAH